MWGHKPGPAPCPQEIAAASTSASGAWKAEQLAEWGVAWPPKGWRRDLEEKHRLGLRVVPLRCRESRRGDRRGPDGLSDREVRRQEKLLEGVDWAACPAVESTPGWLSGCGG